jgi:hypothetical protein
VRLIRLQDGDSIADIAAVVAEEEEEKELERKESERAMKARQLNGQNGTKGNGDGKKNGPSNKTEANNDKTTVKGAPGKQEKEAERKPENKNGVKGKPKKKK